MYRKNLPERLKNYYPKYTNIYEQINYQLNRELDQDRELIKSYELLFIKLQKKDNDIKLKNFAHDGPLIISDNFAHIKKELNSTCKFFSIP